ncbi:hypothetical protein FM119_06230 [Mycetocola reblochoni REB411]|uniref:Putative Flp pilus-assembly TadG-like N-terminal domain-containing protein n=1 Tax=Mycetocola reblochoni REB411 TaxID=1255698 RepID=A0A1R4J9L4_9MICO|nr:hypothetical protein FM119_06230 [Mycetocola reblochoni REB411]
MRRAAPATQDTRRHSATGRDDGTVLVLTLFVALLLVVLCFGVTSLSAAHGARQLLQSQADAAALVAVDSVDLTGVPEATGRGDAPALRIEVAEAERAAAGFLDRTDSAADIVAVMSSDGRTVTIELTERWSVPWFGDVLAADVVIEATGRARIVVR